MKRRVGCVNHYIWVMDGCCFYHTKSSIRGGRGGAPSGGLALLPGPHPLLGCRGSGWWLGLMNFYQHTSNFVDTHTGVGDIHIDGHLPTTSGVQR